MKRVIRLNEFQLVELIKKAINESEDFYDSDEDFEEVFSDDDYQDLGLDYEESFDDDEFQKKMKNKYSKTKLASPGYGRMEWKKEYEKPYSPIKPTDLPLEKYLASKDR